MPSILNELVGAQTPIIWTYCIEEQRFLDEEANWLLPKKAVNSMYVYDATNQIYDYAKINAGDSIKQIIEVDSPVDAINRFIEAPQFKYDDLVVDQKSMWNIVEHKFPERSILVMLDAPFFMTDPSKVKHTNARLTRAIKNATAKLINQNKILVFVNHHTDIPIELEHVVTYVEHKLPDVRTMKRIVKSMQGALKSDSVPAVSLDEDQLNNIAQQLTGLTQGQAENVLSLANRKNGLLYVKNPEEVDRTFDNDTIRMEKSRLIQKSGTLHIVETTWGMDEVGGMENLKKWAEDRLLIFKHEAREDGIDLPKGLCVVGPGGTGKSWVAVALGKAWNRSVLRLDIGACMGSLLGESEGRLIKSLKDAEAQAPCILFVDEFEKLFAGANGTVNDGGTFQRMYGTWLTWTQSRKADVFVVATTNNVTSIPAPALRKGRFDEVMYVGLPGIKQREEIFAIHLKKRGWDPQEYKIDVKTLAEKTPNRTGSEIEQIVIEGLIRKGKDVGFGKRFAITTKHLVDAIDDVKIMAELYPDEAKNLFQWAKAHRVMMANDDSDPSATSAPSGFPPFNISRKPANTRTITIDESEV